MTSTATAHTCSMTGSLLNIINCVWNEDHTRILTFLQIHVPTRRDVHLDPHASTHPIIQTGPSRAHTRAWGPSALSGSIPISEETRWHCRISPVGLLLCALETEMIGWTFSTYHWFYINNFSCSPIMKREVCVLCQCGCRIIILSMFLFQFWSQNERKSSVKIQQRHVFPVSLNPIFSSHLLFSHWQLGELLV